ncbi:hypothetical protein KY339_06030, partial [Candidatus Woesearchaeota archaeon]|nr:hypothetical protein [Candidatus Woesearchaeota archaeon]
WTTNEYFLDEVKVISDVEDITTQKAIVSFIVTTAEKNNLERVTLRFFPHCDQTKVGPLEVELNGHNLFTAVPNCGYLRPVEIGPPFLISGENRLSFKTVRGIYVIDQILVKTELKALVYPTYYFEINKSHIEDIEDGDLDVELYMLFVDDKEYKKGDIFVSGHLTHLDQTAQKYSRNINSLVREGNNAVEIIPKTTLDIIEIKVMLEEV